MSAGRFRVKSGIELQTAEALIRDLVAMGAVCLLVDGGGQVVARVPAGGAPVALEPVPEYREPEASQESGAVMITDHKPVRIEAAQHAPQHAEATPLLGAGYLHPEMGMGSASTASPPAAPSPPDIPAHAVGGGVSLGQSPVDRVRTALADQPRLRFAAGVFVVLLLGFVPAMIFAQVRAGSYRVIDDELRAEQSAASDIDAWNRLDELRASMLERKRSQQTSIALGGLLIWALCSAGLAYLWFRHIDWDFYRTHARAPSRAVPQNP